MTKFNKIAQISITSALVLLPILAFAQIGNFTPPAAPFTGSQAVTLTEVETLIDRIARFLIIISIVIAVIFIVWGGIMYMMAGDDTTKSGAAKTRIWNGIIGALVVLAVGVILQTLAGLVARTFFQ